MTNGNVATVPFSSVMVTVAAAEAGVAPTAETMNEAEPFVAAIEFPGKIGAVPVLLRSVTVVVALSDTLKLVAPGSLTVTSVCVPAARFASDPIGAPVTLTTIESIANVVDGGVVGGGR